VATKIGMSTGGMAVQAVPFVLPRDGTNRGSANGGRTARGKAATSLYAHPWAPGLLDIAMTRCAGPDRRGRAGREVTNCVTVEEGSAPPLRRILETQQRPGIDVERRHHRPQATMMPQGLQGPNATEERFYLTELIMCITVLGQ